MSDLHDSRAQRRRNYIVAALIDAGAMYPGDAHSYLAEHDAAVRAEASAEVLRKAVTFLEEIGTPITGERTEHERGVMYAARRLTEQSDALMETASAPAPTATPQPEPELTIRQQRLYAEIQRRPRELRSSGPVAALYRTWGVRTAQHEARRDLSRLADLGYLTRAGDDTGRRYDLTRKDGRS